MYKVLLSKKAIESIKRYSDNYRNYYWDLYEDSGIWAEQQIIQGYIDESTLRYKEISRRIISKLENPVVSYPDNEAIIKWRTKILIVNFKDEGETRIITDISIR